MKSMFANLRRKIALYDKQEPVVTYFDGFKLFQKPRGRSDELIISSHGSRTLMGGRDRATLFRKKTVPANMSLQFYGPDRAILETTNIYEEFKRNNRAANPFNFKRFGEAYVDYHLTTGHQRGKELLETVHQIRLTTTEYDVITIDPGEGIMLSEVLRQLTAKQYAYKIHCFFCRSYVSPKLQQLAGRPVHSLG